MKKDNKSKVANLRQKAEELLKKKSLKTDSQLSETNILRLNHELQVHQIELEMQNEELKLAYEQVVERNQAEEVLKESEERFRTLFENSTIGIYRTTPDGQILLANPTLIKLLGYSSFKELAGRNLEKDGFEPSYERTHFMDIMKREGEVKGLESAWTRMDGTKLFISESARAINDKEGKIIYYDGIIEDITLRKKAEQELIIANKELTFQNEEKEKRAAELVIANKELAFQNKEKEKRANELVISNKELVFQNKEKEKRAAELVIANKELAFQNKEKEKRANELVISNKELVFQNKEKEKRATELTIALEQAKESDRLKSAFLTNMSHEIRTPMNGILGFTELLKEPNLSSDDQQDYIQTIQISGARMLNTINSIVDISKIESGLMKVDIKETNINEKIEFTYKFFKPEAEIKGLQLLFKNSLPAKEAIIKTDNEKVYGMLTNLIRNAIKFTYEGSIEFGYEKKGEYLEFFVKDTGIGIPQNQHKIIFERFRQGSESHNRGYEGSGLGLSIAKSYVEMLGGEIWVESEEGKGSIFYFTIPYNAVSEEKIEIVNAVSAEHKEVEIKNLKILIVEDDEISYSFLTRVLQKISHEVLHAITGVQAVEACRNNPDLDLVLMDIRMPNMDGNEATRQIRQFNKDVIIIAQTAFAFSGDREKAIEAGCNNYITKPINYILLKELINKYFIK
jgi:PAS domain S-box-containing protein